MMAYEMRISDWSSDVCSPDLYRPRSYPGPSKCRVFASRLHRGGKPVALAQADCRLRYPMDPLSGCDDPGRDPPRFAASRRWRAYRRRQDRKSVVEGKSVSVRVAIGGCAFVKKKKTR